MASMNIVMNGAISGLLNTSPFLPAGRSHIDLIKSNFCHLWQSNRFASVIGLEELFCSDFDIMSGLEKIFSSGPGIIK